MVATERQYRTFYTHILEGANEVEGKGAGSDERPQGLGDLVLSGLMSMHRRTLETLTGVGHFRRPRKAIRMYV